VNPLDAPVLEHALLPVRPGRAEAFEVAFALARPLISAMPGFRGLSLRRCGERPDTYLLLVGWQTLEDHTEGFRGSPEYDRWRELLHGFYEPFPVVEHFGAVGAGEAGAVEAGEACA
jgi:heme-degrading monooxygenase HmoA